MKTQLTLIKLALAAVIACAAFTPKSASAAAGDGTGTMTVSPTSATAGSTGNSFTFSFRAGATAFTGNASVTVVVPADWTAPQTSSSGSAGFVSASAVGTATVGAVTVSGTGPWTVTIPFTASTNSANGFDLLYAGGGTKVTAPTTTETSTFSTKSKNNGGTLTAIGTSPSITVNPGPIDHYVLSGVANPQNATVAFNVTVTAKDQYNNTVTTDSSTQVTMSSGSTHVTFTSNPITLSSGVATASVTDSTTETISLTATDGNGKAGALAGLAIYTAPAKGDYRSKTSGTWNTASNWETNNGAGGWGTATVAPTTGHTVTVRNGFSMTAQTATVDGVVVQSGGTITAAQNLTLANAAGTQLDVFGTVSASGAWTFSTGSHTVAETGGTLDASGSASDTTISGTVTIAGGTLTTPSGKGIAGAGTFTISSGTVNIGTAGSAGADWKFSGTLNMSGGLIVLGHNWNNDPATMNMTGGTFKFIGSPTIPKTAGPITFYNLEVGGSDQTVKLNGTLTVNANLAIDSGNKINLNGNNATANTLTQGGVGQASGSYTSANDSTYLSGTGTLTVSAAAGLAYQITDAAGGLPAAGVGNQLTITLVDAGGNTVNFSGPTNLTFSGLSTADDGTKPTVTANTGAPVNEGTATTVTFASGVSSVGGILKAYKAGTQTLNVTDGYSTSTSPGGSGLSLTIANVAPTASADAVTRLVNSQIAILVSSLTNLWSDANHDLVTFSGVTSPSANGATVTMNGNYIIYPKTAANANDTITYTIGDGTTTSSGSINITISSTPITGQTNPKMTINGSTVTIQFYGVKGFNYTVQKATNPSGPWSDYQTISNCPGPFTVTDSVAGAGYYRLAWNP